jgi:hypothetical protein
MNHSFSFSHTSFTIKQIDICVNVSYGIRNTQLIGNYIAQDPRVRPLLLLIKKWTKAKGIANTHNSTISSYSWTLLVIHFLLVYQVDGTPILTFMNPSEMVIETQNLDDSTPVGNINLAQLFVSFFVYYGLDHAGNLLNSVIQFHPTEKFIKKAIHDQSPNWRLSLIDPLDATHDLGTCIRRCEGQIFIMNQLREVVDLFDSFISTEEQSYEELLDRIFEVNSDVINLPQLCSLCSSESHLSRHCPEATCFACGQHGHISSDCANKICFRCHQRHSGGLCPTKVNEQELENTFSQFRQDLEVSRCSGEMLLEAVLHWSFQIISGPSLLPTNFRPIPLRFESSIEWFTTFYPFMQEDLRCNLKGLIQSYGSDDDGEVRFLHPLIKVGYRSQGSVVSGRLSFNIKDEFEKLFIEKNVSGLALFIRGKVEGKLEDLLLKTDHFLVHVDQCVDPIKHPHEFKCQFPKTSLLIELQESNCQHWRLLVLGSHLAGLQRVCDALGRRNRPCFMKDILRGKVHEDSIESTENQEPIGDLSTLASLSTLNQSQNIAIRNVLQVGLPDHPRIQIIKGPPGTIVIYILLSYTS